MELCRHTVGSGKSGVIKSTFLSTDGGPTGCRSAAASASQRACQKANDLARSGRLQRRVGRNGQAEFGCKSQSAIISGSHYRDEPSTGCPPDLVDVND